MRIGFNRRGSHDIADMTMCLVLRPELFALVDPLRGLPLLRDGERADVLLAVSQGAIDLVLERRRPLDLAAREALAAFAERHDVARISWRPGPRVAAEPVCHRRPFAACFGETLVNLPPGGFLQATEPGEAALAGVVAQALPDGGTVLDLFSGSGTFSFVAATKGRVHAAEGNPEAIAAIRAAGHRAVTAEVRDLFRDPIDDFTRFDAAIFDPPYVGGETQATALARSGPALVVGISCNPVSFARDARLLCDGGYRLEQVVPVDQFLWSAEVEVAALFRR
jgi:23S rRNA (uracil1939-C5)-methyltransferase